MIQSPTSNVCGLYTALYCYMKSKGHTFSEFVNLFEIGKFWENDCKAVKLCTEVFGTMLDLIPTKKSDEYCSNN